MAEKRKSRLAMMPFWTGDYLAATRGLTLAERGAYTDLLFYSWELGGLPDNIPRQARMLGITVDEFREVLPAIRSHFHRNPETGLVVNERLEEERRISIAMREDAQVRGKNGGKTTRDRWLNDPEAMKAKAPSHARSKASSHAKGRLRAIPQASIEPGLKQGPPASSSTSSPSEAQRERNSEAEPTTDTHTHGLNGRGK